MTTSGASSGATAVPSGSTRARGPVGRKAVVLRYSRKLASAARASRSSVRTSASLGAPGLGASSAGSGRERRGPTPAPRSSTARALRALLGVGCLAAAARPSRAASGVSTTSPAAAPPACRRRSAAPRPQPASRRTQATASSEDTGQPTGSVYVWWRDFHSS